MKWVEAKNFPDERGVLFELFRNPESNVAMAYVITINPGHGRAIDEWHYHNLKTETFFCVKGLVRLAVEKEGNVEHCILFCCDGGMQHGVVVEPGEGHSVFNPSDEEAVVIALCDRIYDPKDELRKPMDNWQWKKYLNSP
jgi:dTDP-4-dehydrorhamnose 3,5-epimerase-like enzyme